MTVKELITELLEFDMDTEVEIGIPEEIEDLAIKGVESQYRQCVIRLEQD